MQPGGELSFLNASKLDDNYPKMLTYSFNDAGELAEAGHAALVQQKDFARYGADHMAKFATVNNLKHDQKEETS